MVFTQRELLEMELEAYNRIMDKYGLIFMGLCEIEVPTAGELELIGFLKERLNALYSEISPICKRLDAMPVVINCTLPYLDSK